MIKFHEAQSEIAKDKHRFRVCSCGRRFGKTVLAVYEILGKALYRKEGRIAYIAPTYQQARDICWEELKKASLNAVDKINESRLEIDIKNVHGGISRIFLRGWESVESLRGQRFDFIVIDEIAMMRNFWMNWQEVVRPTLTDTRGEGLFISTPKGFNHFYDLYNLEKKDEDFKSFHYTSYANTTLSNIAIEIEAAKKQITEDRFHQEYMADFRKMEGLVYKEFDRKRHLFDDKTILPQGLETICGVDFGYTNPAAILKIVKDADNNYWIHEEWYKRHQTNEKIINQVKQYNPHKVYADPAEPDRLEEMENAGLNVMEVSKDIANGINAVREMFKQNRIKIHQNCINLIGELETYAYPDKKPDKNESEVPIKENDHLCLTGDTLITTDKGKKRLKNIRKGDIVKTSTGYNEVTDWALTEKNAEVYELILENGYKLKGIGNHPIYTNKGKKRLDALRYGDIIEIDNNISLWKKELYTKISHIIGMANVMHRLADIKTEENGCARRYGGIAMDEYRKVIMSTAKTEIERIIGLIILNLKQLRSIYRSIQRIIGKTKNLEKKILNISRILDTLQRNGTDLKKEKECIATTQKNVGKQKKQLLSIAMFVAKNMKHIFPQDQDFAIKTVKLRRCGKEDVYNITVANDHNYYANGILVSNCDALRYSLYCDDPIIDTPIDAWSEYGLYNTNYK